MSAFIKLYRPSNVGNCIHGKIWRFSSSVPDVGVKDDDEEFRVLDLSSVKQRQQKRVIKKTVVQPDRAERMPTDQNWGNVWPGPRSFHPSSVPLPMHQGYVPKGYVHPGKKANAEIMKVPNFLHLTPPVIKTQCEALKQFCTEWPKLLNSEEAIEKHYPVETITSDYCHASPSIRNPLARIAILRVKLSSLNLDKHARDKFLRLVGDRYDEVTDLVTFTADRCPARKQNIDYVNYLLTACYHESWTIEDWEKEKLEEDMEYYDWNNNKSKRSLVEWYMHSTDSFKELSDDEIKAYDISSIPMGEQYRDAVSSNFNEGESSQTTDKYAEAVRKLLGLPEKKHVS